ncbi:MAG: peptidase C69 [Candidatus Aquicultor secundus]|uniref:Peptidase C69 n=1 Tax=Candidatus Aquicultor secundus TaxID=1973895 RepID=A0A2M7T5Y8_9ACTN|nr:TldD/PmbA family protein [Candidatus Aquicultor secundus]NCO65559.1 TldD/PmbA family protein [Solirubrobacter sp.]OIO87929.1 MAG: peptidase C69 [Candidatus Aquicultor secundus]PIU26464.1 MAG: peptidase C69 [Candidatus Aquicultor secundus]PIW21931.1 MAG: peptidase C69 [Candidatus Aquicultor secundus]PIX52248.1 MAG: peptidase C69 [Candidatus Aquicultor secundus]
MKELTSLALDVAKTFGATYADIRIIEEQSESITIKKGRVEEISASTNYGFGVRVLANGAWGFAGSFLVEKPEVERIARLAVEIAKASAILAKQSVGLSPAPIIQDSYKSDVEIDPFAVSLEDKLALLSEAEEIVRKTQGVTISSASMNISKEKKIFANLEGSYIEQEITESGAVLDAVAIKGSDIQERSYPNSHGGDVSTAGYEFIQGMLLKDNASRIAEEAVQLLSAKPCPSGELTVILNGDQLALQVHESCGHPVELDRVLGMEASFAGTSFLTLDKLNKFQYGSPVVNINSDATIPRALGTFGYDDEGVPAQRFDIIKNGVFAGYLTSRETAPVLRQASNGCMRADGWGRLPLIRMTNVNLLPGNSSLEGMIEGVKDGLFLSTNRSWSIDDKRLNFQFATQIGWEIKNGKLGAMIKNPNYTGITPEFWNSCDAIAGKDEWRVWGLANCGKGEPMQVAHVAHGAAPARFRNVKVGVGR